MTAPAISQYQVLRRLGVGGMGEVFLANDIELERLVALKVMSVELARDPNQRKRFRAEAKAASGLVHPNICVIHDVGETEDGRPFLAMEYVEGQTLDLVLQHRRLRIREILRLGIELSGALAAAHARGIVHRDIKPANIMLDAEGHAKVLDFGLAKRFEADQLSAGTTSMPQTKTGMLVGTPHYMSPEQALGHALDHHTDIFSLGVVLYEAITGQRPFIGRTVGEVINKVINHAPEPLGLENPLYTPALDNIVFKCLEKAPENRYSSANVLLDDLKKLRTEAERAALVRESSAPGRASTPAPSPKVQVFNPLRKRWVGLAGAALAILAILGFIWHNRSRTTGFATGTSTNSASLYSIAVLPFDNFSGEPDSDYLSDGLTEEITTALSHQRGIKVAARNSAFTFKGKKEDVRKVGAALHVNTILEGSVRKSGNRIRVSAQLINVADGFHLWSETFDQSVEDIITVQRDIARRIANRLQSAGDDLHLPARPVNPEAHEAYLRARLFWNKRTESGLKTAVELFQQALARDPNYAAAHAGLASTYLIQPIYSSEVAPEECSRLARNSANRALELDPASAEAHAVLGTLQNEERNLKVSEEHFRRSLELDPNFATAHQWYGRFLMLHERREQALAELQIAADLDPLSPVIQASIVNWYYLGADFARAVQDSRRLLENFPDFVPGRGLLITALCAQGDYQQALLEIDKARALEPNDPLAFLDWRGYALARLGQTNLVQEILAQVQAQQQRGKRVYASRAIIYVGLKDYDKALDALAQLGDIKTFDEEMLCDPLFKEFREFPRVQEMLRKTGPLP